MKRKIIGIIAGLAIAFSFTACGEEKESHTQSKGNDDIEKKYSISIDGEEYNFPMSYEEFKDYGWTYYIPEQDDLSKWNGGLAGGMTGAHMYFSKGDIECLEFLFYNPADESTTYDKCQVVGVAIEYGQTIEGKDAENFIKIPQGAIVINNDVKIGEASKEQVNQSLGKDWTQSNQNSPDYKQLNTLLYYFSEKVSGNAYMTLAFDESGVCNEMAYTNLE